MGRETAPCETTCGAQSNARRRFFKPGQRRSSAVLEEETPVSPTEPMPASPMRGLFVLCVAYFLGVATFAFGGYPIVAATFLGGSYALSALAALLFSRGILELFVGIHRDIAFFTVLRKISDPLMALIEPLTPGFLLPFAASLYGAFLLYFLKTFLFGDAVLGVPPLFILLWFFLAAA
jgi:hypothetical protein